MIYSVDNLHDKQHFVKQTINHTLRKIKQIIRLLTPTFIGDFHNSQRKDYMILKVSF